MNADLVNLDLLGTAPVKAPQESSQGPSPANPFGLPATSSNSTASFGKPVGNPFESNKPAAPTLIQLAGGSTGFGGNLIFPPLLPPHHTIPSSLSHYPLIPSSLSHYPPIPSSLSHYPLIPSSLSRHPLIPSSLSHYPPIPSSLSHHPLIPSSLSHHPLIPSSLSHPLLPLTAVDPLQPPLIPVGTTTTDAGGSSIYPSLVPTSQPTSTNNQVFNPFS